MIPPLIPRCAGFRVENTSDPATVWVRCTFLAGHRGACWFPVPTRRRPRWWLEQQGGSA